MTSQNIATLFDLDPSWTRVLSEEFGKEYVSEIESFVGSLKDVCPPKELIFEAFRKTPFDQVKVVIIGQDPYHGKGQAQGLSFSVPKGVPIPPSLRNIYKELHADVGFSPPDHGCLLSWAEQGVLLLNATLTVKEGEALSHHGIGWETFTDAVVKQLVKRDKPVIFVLWGNSAKMKGQKLIKNGGNTAHTILEAAHPSPLSAYRGFFGCRHFSKINAILREQNQMEIDWKV